MSLNIILLHHTTGVWAASHNSTHLVRSTAAVLLAQRGVSVLATRGLAQFGRLKTTSPLLQLASRHTGLFVAGHADATAMELLRSFTRHGRAGKTRELPQTRSVHSAYFTPPADIMFHHRVKSGLMFFSIPPQYVDAYTRAYLYIWGLVIENCSHFQISTRWCLCGFQYQKPSVYFYMNSHELYQEQTVSWLCL